MAAPFVGVAAFSWLSVYRQIVRFTGLGEAWRMVRGIVVATLALTALSFFLRPEATGAPAPGLSRVVFVTFAMWSLAFTNGWRLSARAILRPLRPARRTPVIVFGAGAAASAVLADMARDPTRRVVAIADDDPALRGRELHGIRVWSAEALPDLIDRYSVETVLLAVPAMPMARRRTVVDMLARSGASILTVPTLRELVEGRAPVEHLREVAIEDLLGRDPVAPDTELLTKNITGRAVLVTGAGGSIGSELCRQIVRLRPRELVLLEQNEFALYSIDRELRAAIEALPADAQPALRAQLGSVTDGVLMDTLLRRHRICTVYHAAACKHVPIVEENEVEGVRTNSFGTLVAARASAAAGVERFVLISTDKAVRPTSVMGASKRLAEMMLQALQAEFPLTRFVMVRFGNVLGSSGSVVPLFREQIRAGGPVTVTDAEMTRYFMTIPEAAELVLQAGALGTGGEVFVLDMGEPVRIIDLARRMIGLAGRSVRDADRPDGDIEIQFTGLRPGEKLFEELVIGADLQRTVHPGVLQAREDYLPWKQLEQKLVELEFCLDQRDATGLRRLLRETLGEYQPSAPEPNSAPQARQS
ncbi:MAG: polysaccharide biosynthesis protein [Phycisphaerae bacterium]|nr:polysaccharide biosynthesis protein [Phycisphaerae bacterium]